MSAAASAMQPDLHLLQRYHRHGDAEAFQSLVEAHSGMVHATACRVTQDPALAQDVAQETFLALARSSGAAIQSVGGWLHHVAWQKAVNTVRGESRRRGHEAASAHLNEPSKEAAWTELEPFLDDALAELPEQTRAIIVARYLEGSMQQDLAARLGISQSTVSRQLEAAMHELRCRLRAKGVLCGAGLAALLGAHSAPAAPAGLTSALGKISISGLGTQAAAAPGASALLTTTLTAMTTSTKLLIAAGTAAVFGIPLVLQKPETPPSKKQPVQAQAKAARSQEVTWVDAGTGKRIYRPAAVTPQVRNVVDGIIRRHQGMTQAELQKSPELMELADRLAAAMSEPGVQEKLEGRIGAIQGMRQGMTRMDFPPLHTARGRALLEAVISEETQLITDWMLNILDDAVFELALDPDLEKTSAGVSFHTVPPAKTQAPADPDAHD